MKFEIIKNSQSSTGWNIPDHEYMGQTCHMNGWVFELAKADGTIGYSSAYFTYRTAEDYISSNDSEYLRWCMSVNDLTFTGRVIFRGYYEDDYDLIDGKWEQVVEEVPFDIGDLLYAEEVDDAEYGEQYDYLYDMV